MSCFFKDRARVRMSSSKSIDYFVEHLSGRSTYYNGRGMVSRV